MTNVPVLQDTLDRLTTKIERWGQTMWCQIPGGVDDITAEDVARGSYHDFELPPEFVEWFHEEREETLKDGIFEQLLPVADCGTSFCVAGDVATQHGYTFMAEPGADYAAMVVPSDRVIDVMRGAVFLGGVGRSPAHVAAKILDLTGSEASALFSQYRSLPEIWGLAYAFTDGKIKLPETLPEAPHRAKFEPDSSTPATTTALETRRAIFEGLYHAGRDEYNQRWVELAYDELDKLGAVES